MLTVFRFEFSSHPDSNGIEISSEKLEMFLQLIFQYLFFIVDFVNISLFDETLLV